MLTLNDYYNLVKQGFYSLKRDIDDALIFTEQEQAKLNKQMVVKNVIQIEKKQLKERLNNDTI